VSRLRRNTSKLATAITPRQQSETPKPFVIAPTGKIRSPHIVALVAATFFMVSGGTYGTEEIVHGAGYGRAILILLTHAVAVEPATAFMIGELSSALPYEGGYYAWFAAPWAIFGDFRRRGFRWWRPFSIWRFIPRYLWPT